MPLNKQDIKVVEGIFDRKFDERVKPEIDRLDHGYQELCSMIVSLQKMMTEQFNLIHKRLDLIEFDIKFLKVEVEHLNKGLSRLEKRVSIVETAVGV